MDEELDQAAVSDIPSEEQEVEENSIKLHEEARKVTLGLGDSARSFSPDPVEPQLPAMQTSPPPTEQAAVPNWRKVNALLSQFGFPPIPVRMGGNLDLIPDQIAVCEVLLRVLAELQRRKPTLDMDNLRTNQRLLAELNSLRGEKAAIEEENEKIRYKLDTDRIQFQGKLKEVESQVKEMERQNKVMRNKLDTAYQLTKQREQTIAELKNQLSDTHRSSPLDVKATQDRERAIFRRMFNREAGQSSVQDAKVLSLISIYEENRTKTTPRTGRESPQHSNTDSEDRQREFISQIQRLSQEKAKLEAQRKLLYDENVVLKAELQERPTVRQMTNLQEEVRAAGSDREANEVLRQVLSILDLRNPKHLPSAVDRMQQVIRAVPNLENFIKAVRAEVNPGSADERTLAASVDEVIPTIRQWKHRLEYYDALVDFRDQLCQMLGLETGPTTPDFDIVGCIQIRAIKNLHGGTKELQYFKSLFEVTSGDEVVKVMNQVFLFVHEMKALLQVTSTQFSREALGLDPSLPLNAVIESIKYSLQR